MLDGNLIPGRYFTFSWRVLINSLSFTVCLESGNSTSSSNTHILTVVLQNGNFAALRPTFVAIAEPQLPEPMMHIRSMPSFWCLLDDSGVVAAANEEKRDKVTTAKKDFVICIIRCVDIYVELAITHHSNYRLGLFWQILDFGFCVQRVYLSWYFPRYQS